MSLNFNEIGQVIRINVGKDISASTPTLVMEPEVGRVKGITNGVTIPAIPVTPFTELTGKTKCKSG